VSGDDRDERPRRSWREIDQARDGTRHGRSDPAPRGAAAEARARQATRESLKEADRLFARGPGGAEGQRLAQALRDAHGTPELAEACAAYRDAFGYPGDPALASIFLDSGRTDLVRGALEALLAASPETLPAGLRSQLRLLAEHSDDAIAGAADDLLQG
jgi:hypothetical protein